jgi:hypothetical protein
MVRFLVEELSHLDSNFRFDVDVVYLRLIILLVVGDVIIDNETFLIDFVNFKIKSVQFFEGVHRDSCIHACIYRG